MARCFACQSEYGTETLICPRDGSVLGDGTLEGRYRVHRRLGAGGMGVVYLAEHIALQKRVAVKVLKGELSRDPALARRFELEARAASRIGHEGITDVTDFGRTAEGALYFVMEYLDGEALSAVLRRHGRFSPRRALDILVPIAEALEAAHAHGIVHRDIKPQNVMLVRRRDGREAVKLLDFGVSKVSTDRAERLTEQGTLLGTAEYMSPEQGTGEAVDARTDIYAFGVLAYELVTGTLPFSGRETMAVLFKHVTEMPEAPGLRAPGIPSALEALILRALAKKPEDRPQTMGEVLAELRPLRESLPPEPLEALAPAPAVAIPAAPAAALAEVPSGTEPLSMIDTQISPVRASRGEGLRPGTGATSRPPPVPASSALHTEAPAVARPARRYVPLALGAVAGLVAVAGVAFWMRAAMPASTRTEPPTPTASRAEPAGTASIRAEPPTSTASRAESAGTASLRTEPAAPAAPSNVPAAPASAAAPRVTVRSVPPGASVYRGAQLLGVTPLVLDATNGELRVTLDGYRPARVRLPAGQERVDVTLSRQPARPAHSGNPYDKVEDLKSSPY